jgi:hypothetical protein
VIVLRLALITSDITTHPMQGATRNMQNTIELNALALQLRDSLNADSLAWHTLAESSFAV